MSPLDSICRRFFVSGKVQGVWYRAATREKALGLALSGYARNLSDGRVEVVVLGQHSAVRELELWLWEGPPAAAVADVTAEAADASQVTSGRFVTL